MKKLMLLLIVLLLIVALFVSKLLPRNTKSPIAVFVPTPTVNKEKPIPVTVSNTFLFVPYWALDGSTIRENQYNGVIYFGIGADNQGIDKTDQGYKKINQFLQLTKNIPRKILAIRMIDTNQNASVLKDSVLQKEISDQAIIVAKDNSFEGILLDFEYSAIGFQSVISRINAFYTLFEKDVKKNNLSFSTTLYGDLFYRLRPYDVPTIAKLSDTVFIMAYDFHKANGDPGPSFPLSGRKTYGYDFTEMVEDFSKIITAQKLAVVFGLYGYDWIVDEKTLSKGPASVLTLNQINQKFFPSCPFTNCSVTRDPESAETHISYRDENNQLHSLWYEDMDSVSRKRAFLEQHGIGSIGLWAYSYF